MSGSKGSTSNQKQKNSIIEEDIDDDIQQSKNNYENEGFDSYKESMRLNQVQNKTNEQAQIEI